MPTSLLPFPFPDARNANGLAETLMAILDQGTICYGWQSNKIEEVWVPNSQGPQITRYG